METRKKPLLQRPFIRLLVIWIFTALSLIFMALLLSGVQVDSLETALRGAAIIWLASEFVAGFEVSNLWVATLTALGIMAVNIIISTLLTIDDDTRDFYAYFADPYNFSRTLLLLFWDLILERCRFWQQRRKDVQPRLDKHHRNFKYAPMRGGTTIFLRELNIYTLIGDIFAGVPSAYATFVGYDEVAHHSGVETHDAFDALHKIDQQLARLESAAEKALRPYHFVILSDHGQRGGCASHEERLGNKPILGSSYV